MHPPLSGATLGRLIAVAGLAALGAAARAESHRVLLGTYTRGGSQGIYSVLLDGATGALSAPVLEAKTPNPTFLALSPDGRFLYAHGEAGLYRGQPGGAISAFALDRASGQLTFLNTQPTGGPFTSFLTVDPPGRMLFTASGSGSAVIYFPIEADGRLGPRRGQWQTSGPPGPVADRQAKPYPHSIWFAPDGRYFFVCDLGVDRVFSYRYDAATGAIAPNDPAYAALPPGTGPRHAKFSADGRFFYVLGELAGTVTPFAYDARTGTLTRRPGISALPAGFAGLSTASEIRIHPNGRFLYTANRGDDSLAVFARDPAAGTLTLVEIVPSGGKTPRNFALSPEGAWLLCAHQDSDRLTVFRVDSSSGRLERTAATAVVPEAVCVLFLN